MPRRGFVPVREILPDPVYNDVMIAKFINKIMKDGKRSVAEKIFYGSLDIIKEKTKKDPVAVFHQALENVMPVIEVKPRRVGGATYQVPVEVRPSRKEALGFRWVIAYARARGGKTMAEKLAAELIDASSGVGASIKKREDTHKMAEANKAFAHYRF